MQCNFISFHAIHLHFLLAPNELWTCSKYIAQPVLRLQLNAVKRQSGLSVACRRRTDFSSHKNKGCLSANFSVLIYYTSAWCLSKWERRNLQRNKSSEQSCCWYAVPQNFDYGSLNWLKLCKKRSINIRLISFVQKSESASTASILTMQCNHLRFALPVGGCLGLN